MTVAFGYEPERVWMKLRFKDGGQKSSNHFLCYPVLDYRNAERSRFLRVWAFTDMDASQWQRPKLTCFQLFHERREVFLSVDVKHFDADFVHTRGPTILLDRFESLLHEFGSNPPSQRVYLDLPHGEPFT